MIPTPEYVALIVDIQRVSWLTFLSRAFMDQVEEGTIEISAADLPSFLYETGTVFNPENRVDGLF